MGGRPNQPDLTDEDVARFASQLRVADANADNGAFASLTAPEARQWLTQLGMKEGFQKLYAMKNTQKKKEGLIKKLRLALWDVQRLELLFPASTFSKAPNLKLSKLPTWPEWKDPHPELRSDKIGVKKMDAYADADRLDKYVMRHFQMMAFTQADNAAGVMLNSPRDITGAWIGSKRIMGNASLDITREGGKATPFVTYFSSDRGPGTSMLIMEILDVKQATWPELRPDAKFLEVLKEAQEIKFGDSSSGPLNPMMQIPKVPVVVVRYSYMEGRPKGGSQFTLHLESRLKKMMSRGTSPLAVRKELQYRLACGEEMPEEHIRMLARLLSYNADLVDKGWADELQSPLSADVRKECRISFFVPCPRIRFKALEEIETGKSPDRVKICYSCGKDDAKSMCSICRGPSYCDLDCSKADWPEHKVVCQFSEKLVSAPASLPSGKLYAPVRAYVQFVPDWGFANDYEACRVGGRCPPDECARNEYGKERFLCKVLMPQAGMLHWDPHQATMVPHQGRGSAVIFDRRRSITVRIGFYEQQAAKENNIVIPFHREGYEKLIRIVTSKGYLGQMLYVWVKRIGDCIEIDLEDIPTQSDHSWD